MPTYRVTVAGREYTVEIPNINARPVRAIVDGEVIEVYVEGPAAAGVPATPVTAAPTVTAPAPAPATLPVSAPPTPTASASAGAGAVRAPLPGTIVSISVAEGDHVEYGQELCILEAMKMNNPIRATQAGTVTEIHIYIGQQVQHDELLLTIAG